MADQPKLDNPLIRVVMDDGAVHEVQIWNKDMLAWDRTRTRRKWPAAEDAPIIWQTFLAWTGLTREGQIPSMTLDEFETHALQVRTLKVDDDDEESGVDPTQPDPEPT